MFCKSQMSRYFVKLELLNYCVDNFRTLPSDLCIDHSVKSTDLTAQCFRFLFLSMRGPKICIALERIAQIYLPYLPLFASLVMVLVVEMMVMLEDSIPVSQSPCTDSSWERAQRRRIPPTALSSCLYLFPSDHDAVCNKMCVKMCW